jgi:hypothetical protein
VFARTAVLEEYARWLACERAVTVDADGSVTVNSDAVATLAGLPVDSFERCWPQMTQPALALYLRCSDGMDNQPENDERAARWLTDLQAVGRRFGPCGRLAVDATIDSLVNSEFDVSDIADDLERSGLLAAVAGCSDRFDVTYRHAEAPRPATDDVTDLVTTVAAVGAWLDKRSAGPGVDVAASP